MNISRTIYVSFLLSMLAACGPRSMYIEVQVKDKFTNANLDSVQVDLYRSAIGGSPQLLETRITQDSGICQFNIQVDENYRYQVEAQRKHYIKTIGEDGSNYLHQAQLEIADTQKVLLFLESILPPDPERFEKMHPNVPISQVIAAISADEWSWAFLPKIKWEDIPILLNQGQDSSFVKNYPRNPRSRYKPDSIRAGLVALWLVEALRQQKINHTENNYSLSPPSRAPVLGTRKGNPSGLNSVEQVLTAYEAYKEWWEKMPVDSSDRAFLIRQNPLEGRGISWM